MISNKNNNPAGMQTQSTEGEPIDKLTPIWEAISPADWRNSIYSDEASSNCMGKLFVHEVKFFKDYSQKVMKDGAYDRCAIVEVGMGTAELFSKVTDSYDYLVGVDFNGNMIDTALDLHKNLAKLQGGKVRLQQGNAVELTSVITSNIFAKTHEFWSDKTLRVNCMCMNTFGILPPCVQKAALAQMFNCSGPGGKVIIGCWHAPSLRTGFDEFYSQHPELCGPCKPEDCDLENGDFKSSSSNYTSHWWTEEELGEVLRDNFPGSAKDLEITFEVFGVGIFAICNIA